MCLIQALSKKKKQQTFLSHLLKLSEAGIVIMVCIFKEKTQELRLKLSFEHYKHQNLQM